MLNGQMVGLMPVIFYTLISIWAFFVIIGKVPWRREAAPSSTSGVQPFTTRAAFLAARMEMDLDLFLGRAYVTPASIRCPLKGELDFKFQDKNLITLYSGASQCFGPGGGIAGSAEIVLGDVPFQSHLIGPEVPGFVVGRWYRIKAGYFNGANPPLRFEHLVTANIGRFTESEFSAYSHLLAHVEPAVPRVGEWWEKKPCASAHRYHEGDMAFCGPRKWEYDPGETSGALKAETEAALCGCLFPVNHGRGLPLPNPFGLKSGHWVRLTSYIGGAGHPGTLVRLTKKSVGLSWVGDCATQQGLYVSNGSMVPATPAHGEWWEKNPCHDDHGSAGVWDISKPFQSIFDDTTSPAAKAALCGCLVPCGFGKGPDQKENQA